MKASKSTWHNGPDGERAEVGTFVHEGRAFEASGALVSADHLICYPHEDGTVRDWQGNVLGTYRIISSRPAVFFGHSSHWGDRYYYMRATVDGRTYSIRGFGTGMIAKGKAIK